MATGLKPYPEYKDSGVPWLGQVPEQWRVDRPKWLFQKMDRPVRENDNIVTCFRDGTVTLRKNRRTSGFTTALKEIGYQGIRRGDLVIHAMDAFAGAVGVSDSDGKGSPVYSVCEALPKANAGYYAYIIREMARSQWILALATGIRERSTDFRYGDFACQSVPVPPLSEQAAIVRYLDHADRKVRHAIRARQQLIKLLTEQKQSIIQRAVTRGLNPDVRLKPSGVPWLGDVPEHWEVLRSKYIYHEVDSRSATGEEKHLSMSQTLGLVPSSQVEERRLVSESYAGAKLCERGDLVLNRLKAHLGVFAVAPERGLVSPDYTVLRPIRRLDDQYFEAVYRTPACRVELRQRAKGIVQGFWRLYTDDFYNIRVPVPPADEQTHIMTQLGTTLLDMDAAIDAAHREIDLLREYRTRLIADVVTGKLDVRNVPVPSDETDVLPEELESIDDVDAADQGDDATEENSDSSTGERA